MIWGILQECLKARIIPFCLSILSFTEHRLTQNKCTESRRIFTTSDMGTGEGKGDLYLLSSMDAQQVKLDLSDPGDFFNLFSVSPCVSAVMPSCGKQIKSVRSVRTKSVLCRQRTSKREKGWWQRYRHRQRLQKRRSRRLNLQLISVARVRYTWARASSSFGHLRTPMLRGPGRALFSCLGAWCCPWDHLPGSWGWKDRGITTEGLFFQYNRPANSTPKLLSAA